MQKTFQNLQEDDIDWETLTIKPSSISRLSTKVDSSIIQKLKLSPATLRNSKIGISGKMNLKAFSKHLKDLEVAINLLSLKDQASVDELRLRFKNIEEKMGMLGIKKKGRADTNQTLVDEVRLLAKDVLKIQSISSIEGLLAEAVVGQASSLISSTGNKALDDLITGSINGKNIFYEKNFRKDANIGTILGKGYKKSENGISWETVLNPNGKLDVMATIDDSVVGFNVKNYNFSNQNPNIKGISLVRDTNMLYLLQSKIEFLNHYLNQAVLSKDQNNKSVGPDASTIAQANENMKQMLLLLAFSGGGYRTDITSGIKGSVFVINDKHSGRVKLVSINSIFSALVRNNKLLKQVDINLSKQQTWANIYAETAGARINNLLAQVRSKKISVSVPAAVMNQGLKVAKL